MNNLTAIQQELMSPAIMQRIETRLGEKAGTFITSVLDLCGEDKNLMLCDPLLVVKESMKAAALDLPINKNLGFAYVLAYKVKGTMTPSFQLGYKGYLQLGIRTAQYKHLNAGVIYEGEKLIEDKIKGTIAIEGEKTSDNAIAYFCYMQLLNGFEKGLAWSKEKVLAHAKKYSSGYKAFLAKKAYSSLWDSDFDMMATKTMILQLVTKYGPMSIDMANAMSYDMSDAVPLQQLGGGANTKLIDIQPPEPENPGKTEMTEAEKQEAVESEMAETGQEPDWAKDGN